MCSADVLQIFKNSVPEAEFVKVAGNGRLADSWIENVSSGLALYTDGTTGGQGKHAQRKGKSTSNWSKKQRERENTIAARKRRKAEKRLLKGKKVPIPIN